MVTVTKEPLYMMLDRGVGLTPGRMEMCTKAIFTKISGKGRYVFSLRTMNRNNFTNHIHYTHGIVRYYLRREHLTLRMEMSMRVILSTVSSKDKVGIALKVVSMKVVGRVDGTIITVI